MFGKTRIPPYAPSTDKLIRRQYVEENGRLIWFWYTRTGVIVKWSLFLGITILLALYLILGRMHAKKRVRSGLKPKAWNAWLLSRQERSGVDPRYAWPQASYSGYQQPAPGYGPGNYGMHAMPPPVYDPNNRPPMYDGADGAAPMGGTKVDPVQTGVEPTRQPGGDYAPPPGPPPPQR